MRGSLFLWRLNGKQNVKPASPPFRHPTLAIFVESGHQLSDITLRFRRRAVFSRGQLRVIFVTREHQSCSRLTDVRKEKWLFIFLQSDS